MVESSSELVEIVETDGRVVGLATRSQVRSQTLRHRCTYVVVLRSNDELVVHRRADWKDIYPSFWDISFGGICAVGESWLAAAQRELAEEAGIEASELLELGAISYEQADGAIVGRVYLTRYDGAISCPDGEVAEVDYIKFAELDSWLQGRQICADGFSSVLPLLRRHIDTQSLAQEN